jgi:hypothetical protein
MLRKSEMKIWAIMKSKELIYVSIDQDNAIDMKKLLKLAGTENIEIIEGKFIASQPDEFCSCKLGPSVYNLSDNYCVVCKKRIHPA